MTEQLQQCLEKWRAAQAEGEPTLRQEIAYRDGFGDALKLMRSFSTMVPAGDVREPATTETKAAMRS